jgi:hypothetical protein
MKMDVGNHFANEKTGGDCARANRRSTRQGLVIFFKSWWNASE